MLTFWIVTISIVWALVALTVCVTGDGEEKFKETKVKTSGKKRK